MDRIYVDDKWIINLTAINTHTPHTHVANSHICIFAQLLSYNNNAKKK